MYICLYLSVYLSIYLSVYLCMYVCMYICITNKHDPNNINEIHVVFFCDLHKVLHHKNSKMRFLWNRDNEKIDRIL